MIRRKKPLHDQEEGCQAQFDAQFEIYTKNPTFENEKTLTGLYERCSKYSKHCPVCVAGRANFKRGLLAIREGNGALAMQQFKSSMRSIAFKWSRVTSSIMGNGNG